MFSCVAHRDVRVAIDEAFDYVADLRNEVEWNPGARQIMKLDAGAVRAGSTFTADYQGAGVLEISVLEYARPRHLRYLSAGRSLRLSSTIDCAESGAVTTISLRMDVEPSGFFRLVSPLLAMMLRRQFAVSADRLQATLNTRR
jgi:hypothetical protein